MTNADGSVRAGRVQHKLPIELKTHALQAAVTTVSGISRWILSLHTHWVAALHSSSEFIKPRWSFHRIMCRKRKKKNWGFKSEFRVICHTVFFFIRDPHCCSRWIPKNAAQPHNNPMWSPRPGAAHTHIHLLRYQKNPIQIALTPTWQIENQSEKKNAELLPFKDQLQTRTLRSSPKVFDPG